MIFVDCERTGSYYATTKVTRPELSSTGIDIWASGFGTWKFQKKNWFSFLVPDSSDVSIGCSPRTNDIVEDIWDGEWGLGSLEALILHE